MATVYLIPAILQEEGLPAIPAYIKDAIKECHVFFVENERTTRRYFKQLWKEMVIDDYEWVNMTETETAAVVFRKKLNAKSYVSVAPATDRAEA